MTVARTAEPADADVQLLQANLVRVFGERNRERRRAAIVELFASDAVLYEPHAEAAGHDAIDQAVDSLHARLPADFRFVARGTAVGHHGVARLHWSVGPPGREAAATGTDFAHVADGRIHSLHVLLD